MFYKIAGVAYGTSRVLNGKTSYLNYIKDLKFER